MNKLRTITKLVQKNKNLKIKIQILKAELTQNQSNIKYAKSFNLNDPLYFLKNKPSSDEPFLL